MNGLSVEIFSIPHNDAELEHIRKIQSKNVDAIKQELQNSFQSLSYSTTNTLYKFPIINKDNLCFSFSPLSDENSSPTILHVDKFLSSMPRYSHWTEINANQRTDDYPVLTSIPYFGDYDNMEDNSYLRLYEYIDIPIESDSEDSQLQESIYEKLIHRLERNLYSIDAYTLFWSLLSTLHPKRIIAKASENSQKNSNEALNANQVLVSSEASTTIKPIENKELPANDEAIADIKPTDNSKMILGLNLMDLMCPVCCKYDCCGHFDIPPGKVFKCDFLGVNSGLFIKSSSDKSVINMRQPCSEACCRISVMEKYVDDTPRPLDNIERILFDRASSLFPDDPCAQSVFIPERTCSELTILSSLSYEFQITSPNGYSDDKMQLDLKYIYSPNSMSSPLFSCSHPFEACSKDSCSCYKAGRKCSPSCICKNECPNLFNGCSCKKDCQSNACPCFMMNRECHPILCRHCRYSNEYQCKNSGLQNNVEKKLLIGKSDISGWGIFAGEDIPSSTFIAEYTGEIITQLEAERRGLIYDQRRLSFLFNLDKDFVIDASVKGGLIRFANHSSKPNAIAKVMNVLGIPQIGIYSKLDIEAGDEITFDYNYDKEAEKFIPLTAVPRKKKPSKSK